MSENVTGGTPAVTEPSGGTPPQGAGTPSPAPSSEKPTRTPEDYEREIAALKEETIGRRKKLDEYETKLKTFEQANLTESEKAAQRLKELEAENLTLARERQEIAIRAEVERQARRLNLVDEDAAYRLLDLASLTFDDGGKPTNVEALLSDLVKSRSWLVRQETPGGTSATNPAKGMEAAEARWREMNRPVNPFDPALGAQLGGGVHFPAKEK